MHHHPHDVVELHKLLTYVTLSLVVQEQVLDERYLLCVFVLSVKGFDQDVLVVELNVGLRSSVFHE